MKTRWIVPGDGSAGWQHGLPPSLTATTWPRHRWNGLPLVHGFTIRVPEELRVRGKERVALSYFHPGDAESYGPAAALRERIKAVIAGGALQGTEGEDPFFRALVDHVSAPAQANTQIFTDLLGHTHAIVWHTEAELGGARCPRPSEKLPAGHAPKTMHLHEPVKEEEGLAFVDHEPPSSFIQLGGPLHWVQSEADGFGELVMEIEDGVGGANYGCGNCQIDLQNGLLDWAC